MWCIPPKASGEFVAKMEDVLEVYHRPYDPRYPQVCMDELCKQLIRETRRPLPIEPGQPVRYDYEYERVGVCNLFMFFEPLSGRRYVRVSERRTKQDWARAIRDLVVWHYPQAEKIVLVLDNLNIHVASALYETFEPEEARRILEKLEIHYTPKHGSWLNMAEIELSVLSRQCLDRRLDDLQYLKREVANWQYGRNKMKARVEWRFTTQDARIKLARLYPVIKSAEENQKQRLSA